VPDADRVGAAIAGLLARARAAGVPVVHVRNTGGAGDPDEPGTDGWQLVHAPDAGESIVDKPKCDAFAGARPPGSGHSIVSIARYSLEGEWHRSTNAP
jgi:nicotinamidase-related amidase